MPMEADAAQREKTFVRAENEGSSKNYFTATIESELVRAFKLLIDYLPFLFKDPHLASLIYTEEYGEPTETILRVIEVFSVLKQDLEKHGIEIPYKNLCYRYVAAEDSLTIEAIIQNTIAYRGKDPRSKKPWIHVASSTRQLSDFMHRSVNKPGVILLYDKTKLISITEEDMKAFPFHAYYYGMKPNDGLTLKDALLGMIIIST